MSEKRWNIIKWILIVGSILAAIKLIFVDYTLDEEYQIVMAFRRLQGDTLFGTMWEPHQTSAFGCYFLIKIFTLLTKSTDGVVVFIRACTTVIRALLSAWLCVTLKRKIDSKYAFLLGLVYFNYVPKLIEIPEFSNMQLWFFTITVLALMNLYDDTIEGSKLKLLWLIPAGMAMSLEVLSYPSCLALYPVFIICIIIMAKGKAKLRDSLIFTGVCIACGGAWLAYVLSKVSFNEFIRNVKYVVGFDGTHNLDVSAQTKGSVVLSEFVETLILLAIVAAVSVVIFVIIETIARIKASKVSFGTAVKEIFSDGILNIEKVKAPILVIAFLVAEAVQMFYWLVLRVGYERPQIMMVVGLLIPIFIWKKYGEKKLFLPAYIGSIAVVGLVLYMSDLGVWNAVAQAIVGMIIGVMMLVRVIGRDNTKKGLIMALLISLVAVNMFGKGFTVKLGKTPTNTILGIRNVVHNGPAKMIFSHYMLGYIMDSDYADFMANVPENANVLIVTNTFEGTGTTPYMFMDSQICHFSIVDPTTYDEKLLTYWDLYPEKQPDIIVIDCWYGSPLEAADNWIMQYIENDFGYSEVTDGKYVRFYKK